MDELKTKNYTERKSVLLWLTENVPKQKESEFIRNAVKKEIDRIAKKKQKKLSTV